MSTDKEIVNKAVQGRLQELADRIASEAVAREQEERLLEEAALWYSVPEDASDEAVATIIAKINTDPFASAMFRQEFLEDLGKRFIPELRQSDMMRLNRISLAAKQQIENPRIEPMLRIETIKVEPENEGGNWTLIAVPVMIDDSYNVSMPDSLDYDLCLTMHVSPPADQSLTQKFNVPGLFMPAGTPARPLAISYKPDSDGPKFMHIGGYVSAEGEVLEQLSTMERFHVGPELPERSLPWSPGPLPGM